MPSDQVEVALRSNAMEPEGSHFPEAEFFGVRVPEGEIVVVGAVENEEDTIVETYHLTQACPP